MGNTEKPADKRGLKFHPIEEEKFAILTDADIEAIQKEVQAQVLEERKKQARDELKRKLLAEERRISLPDQELIQIDIDLPGHMDRITIDMGQPPNGGVYHHGMSYKVDPNKYATLIEIMMRAWAHEEETGIPNHRTYRRPKNLAIGNFFDPALNGTRVEREVRIGPKNADTPAEALRG
jgi:hypothetical protein